MPSFSKRTLRALFGVSCVGVMLGVTGVDASGQAVRQSGAPRSALLYTGAASFFVDLRSTARPILVLAARSGAASANAYPSFPGPAVTR